MMDLLIDLELNNNEARGCDSSKPEASDNIASSSHSESGEIWLLEHLAECLEWLFSFDRPFRSEEIHQNEIIVTEEAEEKQNTTDSDSFHFLLPSFENKSQLNHQMAIASQTAVSL